MSPPMPCTRVPSGQATSIDLSSESVDEKACTMLIRGTALAHTAYALMRHGSRDSTSVPCTATRTVATAGVISSKVTFPEGGNTPPPVPITRLKPGQVAVVGGGLKE